MEPKKKTKLNYLDGLKVIYRSAKKYQSELYLLSAVGITLAVASALLPFVTGRLLDSIIYQKAIFQIFGVWFVVQISINLLTQIKNRRSNNLGRTINADYITSSFSYLLTLPLNVHKSTKMSVVTNSLSQTANDMDMTISNVIIDLAPQFLSIIFSLIISFSINRTLGLIMVAGVFVYTTVLVMNTRGTAKLQQESRDAWRESFRGAYDAIENTVAVKQMVGEEYHELNNKNNYIGGALAKNIKLYELIARTDFQQKVIVVLTQGLVFLVSIFLISSKEITVGDLLIFNGYTGMLFGPFFTLSMYWRSIQNALVNLEQSEWILSVPPENYRPEGYEKLDQIKGGISLKNVSFAYSKNQPVLSNINFEVKPGDVVALVGKSGEGKSTLIDLISGYHFADKGKVLIDGHDIKKLDLKFLRSQIAVVPQEVVLFNDTIENNIKYGNFDRTTKEVTAAADKAHALEFIKKFPKKWQQVVGERGIKLSVGQKQRVAIARAILRDPKILILDEPTSALDAESEHFITKALEDLMRGRTTFIIAHRLSTVRRADKIFVFQDGKIVEAGKHDELAAKDGGVYRHLYELQIGLHN